MKGKLKNYALLLFVLALSALPFGALFVESRGWSMVLLAIPTMINTLFAFCVLCGIGNLGAKINREEYSQAARIGALNKRISRLEGKVNR